MRLKQSILRALILWDRRTVRICCHLLQAVLGCIAHQSNLFQYKLIDCLLAACSVWNCVICTLGYCAASGIILKLALVRKYQKWFLPVHCRSGRFSACCKVRFSKWGAGKLEYWAWKSASSRQIWRRGLRWRFSFEPSHTRRNRHGYRYCFKSFCLTFEGFVFEMSCRNRWGSICLIEGVYYPRRMFCQPRLLFMFCYWMDHLKKHPFSSGVFKAALRYEPGPERCTIMITTLISHVVADWTLLDFNEHFLQDVLIVDSPVLKLLREQGSKILRQRHSQKLNFIH